MLAVADALEGHGRVVRRFDEALSQIDRTARFVRLRVAADSPLASFQAAFP